MKSSGCRRYAPTKYSTPKPSRTSLCLNDQVPRELHPDQTVAVQALSRQVVAQLELRSALKETRRAEHEAKAANRAKSQFVAT
jgi:GAF domain-containing protein